MKKFLVVALLGLCSTGFIFAADINTPDSLTVNATLQAKYVVTVSNETPIVLDVAGNSTGVDVATVNLYTNKKSWKVGIVSANGGKLKSTTQYASADQYIPYSFMLVGSINGGAETTYYGLTKTPYTGWGVTGTPVYENFTVRTTPGESDGDALAAKITYEAESASWVSDLTYQDTVTITMSAN